MGVTLAALTGPAWWPGGVEKAVQWSREKEKWLEVERRCMSLAQPGDIVADEWKAPIDYARRLVDGGGGPPGLERGMLRADLGSLRLWAGYNGGSCAQYTATSDWQLRAEPLCRLFLRVLELEDGRLQAGVRAGGVSSGSSRSIGRASALHGINKI